MTNDLKTIEDALLSEWCCAHDQARHKNFIADGVVAHELYAHKVLVLLREAHWIKKDDEDYYQDLRHELRHGAPDKKLWRNWQVVARWIYALTEDNPMDWSDLRHQSACRKIFCRAQFQKAAIVNVKKAGGGSSLGRKGWKDIIEYCDEYRDFIRRHIEMCSPNVIICSGTFDLLVNHVYMKCTAEPIRICLNGVRWCQLGSDHYTAIDMPHFGARGRGYTHQKMHEDLVNAWIEIKTTKNPK